MADILCAWELGAGHGHVDKLKRQAAPLRARGHHVTIAARYVDTVGLIAADAFDAVIQAPVAEHERLSRPLMNFGDLLGQCGLRNADVLKRQIRDWMDLLEATHPDLIIVDHAPMALLAARFARVPAICSGSGFMVPPLCDPLPSLRPWVDVPDSVLTACDREILETVNRIARGFGAAPLDRLADIYDVSDSFLWTLSELDHFGRRPPGACLGPLFASAAWRCDAWAHRKGPRLLAYINGRSALAGAMMTALARTGLPLLVYLRGSPDVTMSGSGLEQVFIAPEPIDMAWALPKADLFISHGGIASMAASVLAGTPVLAVPEHQEQTLSGYRLLKNGLGGMLRPDRAAETLGRSVRIMLSDTATAEKVGRLAKAWARYDPAALLEAAAGRCEAVIAGDKKCGPQGARIS